MYVKNLCCKYYVYTTVSWFVKFRHSRHPLLWRKRIPLTYNILSLILCYGYIILLCYFIVYLLNTAIYLYFQLILLLTISWCSILLKEGVSIPFFSLAFISTLLLHNFCHLYFCINNIKYSNICMLFLKT